MFAYCTCKLFTSTKKYKTRHHSSTCKDETIQKALHDEIFILYKAIVPSGGLNGVRINKGSEKMTSEGYGCSIQIDKRNCTYFNQKNNKFSKSSVTANSKIYTCTQVEHLAGSTKQEKKLERIR